MASTNKTSLGLNMWEASDKPVRMDFNSDNKIIDEKIAKLNSDLDNCGDIVAHSVGRAIGTTSDTIGGTVYIPYPTGYNVSNCCLLSYAINSGGSSSVVNGFSDRLQILLTENGIMIYTNHSSLVNRQARVWLFK